MTCGAQQVMVHAAETLQIFSCAEVQRSSLNAAHGHVKMAACHKPKMEEHPDVAATFGVRRETQSTFQSRLRHGA